MPFVSCLIGILLPRFLNLEWMAERKWQAVIWIRCFTRRRFSSSRKNCMGLVLGGTSRMTVPRNSTVLRAAIVVDPAEPTKRFRPDCRKWAIRFCISMRSSAAPTIPSTGDDGNGAPDSRPSGGAFELGSAGPALGELGDKLATGGDGGDEERLRRSGLSSGDGESQRMRLAAWRKERDWF
ncbi:hypothetical protein Drorol1_Dr00028219 [Drosera rotundifolia]